MPGAGIMDSSEVATRCREIAVELTKHPDPYVRSLASSHALREPVLNAVITHLGLRRDSVGIDVGCGIGLPAILAATRSGSRLTGVDLREDFIAIARASATRLGLEGSLTFERGDVARLEHPGDHFDWALSVDCVNYAPHLPPGALTEILRVLKPGGRVALLAWSSQQLLPGYRDLEAQLNLTREGLAPFEAGMPPEKDFQCSARVLGREGFREIRARTFLGEVQAPLAPEVRSALEALLEMRWSSNPTGLAPRERDRFRRLIDPRGGAQILDVPDYYGFFTYTLFTAQKPG